MNKLQLPQAKLFYVVGQAYRKRMIDETQKRLLKEKIITDNVEIFQCLQQNDTESALIEKIIGLVKVQEMGMKVDEGVGNGVSHQGAVVEQEEVSSPWGEFLRRKKIGMKGQQHGAEVKEIKELIKPEKAD